MSIQLLDVPLYNAQPEWGQASVDWTHPLARGLIHYVVGWGGSGTGPDAFNDAQWDSLNLAWPIGPGLQWLGEFANYHITNQHPRVDDEQGRALHHVQIFRVCDATDLGIAGTTSEYTFAARFKPQGGGTYYGLAGIDTYAPGLYHSLLAGKWGLYHGADIPANTTLSTNHWYTLVATRRRGRIWYYLNGVWDGDVANSSSIASGNITLRLGTSPTTPHGIKNWMGFWNRAFEADEAAHIHFRPYDFVTPGYNELPVWVPNAPAGPTIPSHGLAVGSAALRTTVGTQDLTLPGFGTPVGMIAWVSHATTSKTPVDDVNWAYGSANDSGEIMRASFYAEHGADPTNSWRNLSYTSLTSWIVMLNNTGGGHARIVHDSDDANAGPITDGWRVDVTTAPPAGYRIIYMLIGASQQTDNFYISASNTNLTYDIKPDAIYAVTNGNIANNSSVNDIIFGQGFSDGIRNVGTLLSDEDNEATTIINGRICSDAAVGQIWSGGLTWRSAFGSFQSGSPQAVQTTTGSGGTDGVTTTAFRLPAGWVAWAGIVDSPTSAASDWVVSPAGLTGITPQFVMISPGMMTSVDSNDATGNAGTAGIAIHDSVNARCLGFSVADNAAAEDAQSLYAEQWIYWANSTGTVAFDIHPSSNPFRSGGWTVAAADITTADSTARKWPVLVLGTKASVFRQKDVNGLGTGGPFFADPLG